MLSKKLILTERFGVSHENTPVTICVPFKEGELNDSDAIDLISDENKRQIPQITPLAKWIGGSIKWAKLDFQCSVQASCKSEYRIQKREGEDTGTNERIEISQDERSIRINTGAAVFIIAKDRFPPIQSVTCEEGHLNVHPYLLIETSNQGELDCIVDKVICNQELAIWKHTISFSGRLTHESMSHPLKFDSNMTFHLNHRFFNWDFRIVNSGAAIHKGGFWDLGDEGSVLLKKVAVGFNLDQISTVDWRLSSDEEWKSDENSYWHLYQASSGGPNWRSRNHLSADQKVSLPFCGYQVFSQEGKIYEGQRADPVVGVKLTGGLNLHCYLYEFWQNFPGSISVETDNLEIGLLPESPGGGHELQGGEGKTRLILIGFGAENRELDAFLNPPAVQIDSVNYFDADVFPWFIPFKAEDSMGTLIDQGLEGESNFFFKREMADEFGWRNYGDLWADHETIEHENDSSLVSHYNNQYDAMYGFAFQYALTGDTRWFELFDALARHVVDIDTYKTTEDREEYNFGLFWHTDHYMDAATSTHRSFSKYHLDVDHVAQSGGGPGAEHCYSTGLVFHYFMTGCERSKEAAENLATWITKVMEGDGSFLGRISLFYTRDLAMLKKVLSGEKILDHKYPFTRGTGNYINSVLDQYLLSCDAELLVKAGEIIMQCIHPKDTISHRRLEDIEGTWSYTILLQAVARFIYLKAQSKQFDETLAYSCYSFLHYTDWMLKNEAFFLENKEKLEYPNTTWFAQEARKAYLFFVSAQLTNKDEGFLGEGEKYITYLTSSLSESSVLKSTRILAILMQCFGPHSSNCNNIVLPENFLDLSDERFGAKRCLTVPVIIWSLLKDLFAAACNISPKSEYKWLKLRLRSRGV